MSQKKPIPPTITKAASQPQVFAIQGTDKGAKTAPTFAPELKMPVAKDLSFLGKYSAVALIAAGKFPASPKPKMAREIMKPAIETGTAATPNQPKKVAAAVPTGTEYA